MALTISVACQELELASSYFAYDHSSSCLVDNVALYYGPKTITASLLAITLLIPQAFPDLDKSLPENRSRASPIEALKLEAGLT